MSGVLAPSSGELAERIVVVDADAFLVECDDTLAFEATQVRVHDLTAGANEIGDVPLRQRNIDAGAARSLYGEFVGQAEQHSGQPCEHGSKREVFESRDHFDRLLANELDEPLTYASLLDELVEIVPRDIPYQRCLQGRCS